MLHYVWVGFFCVAATLLFALTVGATLKNAAISGVLGGAGYIIYLLLQPLLTEATAVFAATFAVCMSAEVLARVLKTPATVFSIPAILPLVPGLMLYHTLLHFGNGDTVGGLASSVETLIVAGSLALAVTLATLLAKLLFKKPRTAAKK